MQLPANCQNVILIKRYKRFLADVLLSNQQCLTVHCPNSGSMLGCSEPGSPARISHSASANRKYAWTLEMVQHKGVWIGVHTGHANVLVREGLEHGIIQDFGKIIKIIPEVRVSDVSRLDFLLETEQGNTYLEVKNCSLADHNLALFPDAVTKRGTKHLHELIRLQQSGHRAAVLFCVQREDAEAFRPAWEIDSLYAETLTYAYNHGVQVLAYQANICPQSIQIFRSLPVLLSPNASV